MSRRKATAVLIRVEHPQAGEGWTVIDERELSRALYNRGNVTEPIPYELVVRSIPGAWADKDYARERAGTDFKGDPRNVITFDEWKESR